MRRIERRPVHDFDWLFLGLVCLLLVLGFVNLVSATLTGELDGLSDGVRRQLVALAIAGFAAAVILFVDYRHFERLALPLYLLGLVLLSATLVFAPSSPRALRAPERQTLSLPTFRRPGLQDTRIAVG